MGVDVVTVDREAETVRVPNVTLTLCPLRETLSVVRSPSRSLSRPSCPTR